MKEAQDNLAQNFSYFIHDFAMLNLDFQIGVTSTEGFKSNANYTFDHRPENARLRDGYWGPAGSGVYILNNETENLNQLFVTNVTLGIEGAGDERAFTSIEEFFKHPFNSDFLRTDSHLAIIIISDEDDSSYNGKIAHERIIGEKPELYPVDKFVNFLDSATESTGETRRYSVSSIHIKPNDLTCMNSIQTGSQKFGHRYEEFIKKTGGSDDNIISICSKFADSLEGLSAAIIDSALKSAFKISRRPALNTILVKVNGEVIPKSIDGSSGWSYQNPKPDVHLIVFTDDFVPPSGAKVDITFEPAEFKQ